MFGIVMGMVTVSEVAVVVVVMPMNQGKKDHSIQWIIQHRYLLCSLTYSTHFLIHFLVHRRLRPSKCGLHREWRLLMLLMLLMNLMKTFLSPPDSDMMHEKNSNDVSEFDQKGVEKLFVLH